MPLGTFRNPAARDGAGSPAGRLHRAGKPLLLAAALAVLALLSTRVRAQESDVVTDSITQAIFAAADTLVAVGWALAIPLAILELAGAGIAKLRGKKTETIPPYSFATRGAWFLFIFASLSVDLFSSLPNAVILGAESLASSMTGLGNFSPLLIMKEGFLLYLHYSEVTLLHGLISLFNGSGILTMAAHQITGLAVFFAYTLVALATYFLLIQSALTVAVGPIFTALGASRWTAGYFDRYYSYIVFLTVKTILLALVLKAGELLTEWFGATFSVLGEMPFAAFNASALPAWAALTALAFALGALTPGPLANKLVSGGFRFAETFLRGED